MLNPVVKLKPSCDSLESKQGSGRPKKVKPGRPKILSTTRKEQLMMVKKKYAESHPEKHREHVKQYTELHPEINRAAVQRYSQSHPDASYERVQIFRLINPKLSELRHLRLLLACDMFCCGLMAC